MTTGPWTDRTVVVTGALGFIGSHFVEQLAARGARVVGLYRTERSAVAAELGAHEGVRLVRADLTDARATESAFAGLASAPDVVVHCAGLDGNVRFKREHAAEMLDTNQRITSNILNCARDTGTRSVVLVSSSEVYSAPKTATPTSEDDDFRRHMEFTSDGYALSKTYGEILAGLHRQQFGTDVFVVRPGNVYGPRDSFDPRRNRVVPSMIAKAEADEMIEIWGDGSQTRSFLHVADLVRATLCMVETGRHRLLNIGSTEKVSILKLARLVTDVLGRPEHISIDPGRPAGAPSRNLDLSRMFEVIDFTPRSLREGLEDTVRWYRNHRHKAR